MNRTSMALLTLAMLTSSAACGGDQDQNRVAALASASSQADTDAATTDDTAPPSWFAEAEQDRWSADGPDPDSVRAAHEAAPTEEGPDNDTRALLAAFQQISGEGYEQGSHGRFILPDGTVTHFGQLVRGPERLSFSTRQLTEPLAILPPEGSPLREMGSYSQEPDGTEMLVDDIHQLLGGISRSDRQVYVIDPSGRMTEISYRLVEETPDGPTTQEEHLIGLARAMNDTAEGLDR